jgi:phosphoribosylanthranilate isomerase
MAPRIKFCGITRFDDATAAVEAGAWALGVILWPGSPRAGTVDVAAEIVAAYRRRVEVCGVFVDATLDEVAAAVDSAGFSMVQLHGSEGPAYCSEVARRTGAKVVKAARVRGLEDLQALRPFHTDYWLLDARVEGMVGGTGETWDWSLVADVHAGRPLILSGGLTPENVGAGIAQVQPFAVDVASGVESAPGVKDHDKLRAFADAVAATDPAPAPAEAGT